MITKKPKKELPGHVIITIIGEFDYEKTYRFIRMFKKQGYMSICDDGEYDQITKELFFKHYQYYEEGCLPNRLKEILFFLFENDFFITKNNKASNACIEYIEIKIYSKEVLEESWKFSCNKEGLYYDREYWHYDEYSNGTRINFLEMSEIGYLFKK